jgi:hypothetical protein
MIEQGVEKKDRERWPPLDAHEQWRGLYPCSPGNAGSEILGRRVDSVIEDPGPCAGRDGAS